MADTAQTYHVINMFDWTGGIVDKSDHPLAVTENSLRSSHDVDSSGFGLRSRDGSSVVSEFDPGSTVRFITSVHLPTSGATYLLAQVDDMMGYSRLFATRSESLTDGESLSWQGIHDLGLGAGVISVACLNDRVVITEGINHQPLVFAGCLDDSGSDWAVPKAAMVTYNNGQDWNDITDAVCDADPDTAGDIEPLSSEGWLAICCDTPGAQAFMFDISPGAGTSPGFTVEAFTDRWENDGRWSDSTSGLTKSGIVTHSNGPFTASYYSLNNVPGFWFRLRFGAWFPGASIKRILFRCPCQELSVIGDGLSQTPLGFLYHDASENSLKDFTVEASDYAYPTFARLNDGLMDNPTGMQPGDSIFIGYLKRFSSVELTLHNDFRNKNPSVMKGYYWNGTSWAELSNFRDTTALAAGTTLSASGSASWRVPDDWKHNRPVNQQQAHGFWVRLNVLADLTAKTYITEAAVTPVMDRLKKSRLAITVRDRVILLGRSDAPDQMDISRPLEEYGFFGEESASFRIGGQGAITAAVEAFNQGFIAKSDDWYLLNGYSPATFSVERAEAAGQTPINSRVIVRAPHAESDRKNLMGLYYINHSGAWYFAGLKVYRISDNVNWWDGSAGPDHERICLRYLDQACGVYLPDKSQVIWSVPMSGDGAVECNRNNRLIVYDLNTKSWNGPYRISVSAMTPLSGHSGVSLLLGADYHGRILNILDPESGDDAGESLTASARTQWLNFGSPHVVKRLRSLTLHGRCLSSPIRVDVFADGASVPSSSMSFDRLVSSGDRHFMTERRSCDVMGRFFSFGFTLGAKCLVHGIQAGFSAVREWSLN